MNTPLKKIIGLLVSLTLPTMLVAGLGGIIDEASKIILPRVDIPARPKIFISVVEEKRDRLEALLKERAEQKRNDEFISQMKLDIEEAKRKINGLKEIQIKEPDSDITAQQLAIWNDRYQVENDILQSLEQTELFNDQQIRLLQEYLNDTSFENYKKTVLAPKSSYSFEDLQSIYQSIAEQEKLLASMVEQDKDATAELENRKRALASTQDVFKKKLEEREVQKRTESNFGLTPAERAEVWLLEEQLYSERNTLNEQRLKETEQKIGLLKIRIFTVKSHLDTLKELVRKIKPFMTISEATVSVARDELTKKKQQSFAIKEIYTQELERLAAESKKREKELEELSKRYNVPIDRDIDEWSRTPKRSVNSYIALCEVGVANDQLMLIKRRKDLQEAQLALETEKLRYESTVIDIKQTYYKITARKFVTEDELGQEIKRYDSVKAESQANLSKFKERKNAETDLLVMENRALENIRLWREEVQSQKDSLFKTSPKEYTRCLELLNTAEEKIKAQIDTLNKTLNAYTDAINMLTNTIKQIDFIISELGSITIWYRSEYAISLEGVKNIGTDLENFLLDVRSYVQHVSIGNLLGGVSSHPWHLLLFVFLFGLLGFGLSRLRHYIPRISKGIVNASGEYMHGRIFMLIAGAIVGFLGKFAIPVGLWFGMWLYLLSLQLVDPYPYVLFYLFSIPVWLYLGYHAINYWLNFNKTHGYIFLAKEFKDRFKWILSILVYSTIIILFFRAAFMLASYKKSELPDILVAINVIILQISIIFLIAKEYILSIIPITSEFWEWVHGIVDKYYYAILMIVIPIIVMSNPYVGYGKLVLSVLTRVIYTILIIKVILWLQALVKRGASRIFFSTDEEKVRERFAYAKTWYGLTVICLLLGCAGLALIIIAHIWGWPEGLVRITGLKDILEWLKSPLLIEEAGKAKAPISLFTLLEMIGFVIMGIIAAFGFNRFVLGKIFDILPVDAGVQNTISSLARYLIVLLVIIIGFQSVGLGAIVWALLGAIILGIGWMLKEPGADFIAYFIILVQRPIKIGDFIKVDDEVKGVVRKITPRAVVLRRKNSTTIMIPNSHLLSKPFINWNYTRGFIAFDDIVITIAYEQDPLKAKSAFLKVLDESPVILKNPRPVIRLDEFERHGFVFMIRGFISSNLTLEQWDIASDIRIAIIKELRVQNIKIALPISIIKAEGRISCLTGGAIEQEE